MIFRRLEWSTRPSSRAVWEMCHSLASSASTTMRRSARNLSSFRVDWSGSDPGGSDSPSSRISSGMSSRPSCSSSVASAWPSISRWAGVSSDRTRPTSSSNLADPGRGVPRPRTRSAHGLPPRSPRTGAAWQRRRARQTRSGRDWPSSEPTWTRWPPRGRSPEHSPPGHARSSRSGRPRECRRHCNRCSPSRPRPPARPG